MSRRRKYALFLISTMLVGPAVGQERNATPASAEPGAVLIGGAHPNDGTARTSVEACWDAWKAREKLQDGKNERNGKYILISHQKTAVNEAPDSRNWLAGRNQAFNFAELSARKVLAQTISSTISSDRSAVTKMFGGDEAPPSLKPVVEQLSIADKSRVLADKALDNEIRRFDPKWNAPAGENDRREAVAKLQMRINQNIARDAELFASGAFTAVQCEGPSSEDKGRYSVLVGLIWTQKLAEVAETIWNPTLKLAAEPARTTLREQFDVIKAENPNWLAVTNGTRVFTDEKGERVVVGFGVAPQSSLVPADRGRASLLAMAAIQRFVGEKIVSNDSLQDRYEHREYVSGSISTFDTSAYEERIAARSKSLQLKGAAEIAAWRGEHPWSKAGMQVVVVAWSRSWERDSDSIGKVLGMTEQRMEQRGAVPQPLTRGGASGGAGAVAAPVNAGAGVSTSDF